VAVFQCPQIQNSHERNLPYGITVTIIIIIIIIIMLYSINTEGQTGRLGNLSYSCRDSKQVLTCCFNCSRRSSGIPHSAAVCAQDVSFTANVEYSLIGSCLRISHHLCLLVHCSIDCYISPILPPSDSGSRSTSGGAGKGPGRFIIHQCSSIGCA